MRSSKLSINYLYFGAFFFIIALLHCFHVHLIEQESVLVKLQFILYAFFQCFLEVLALALLSSFLQSRAPKMLALAFIGCTMVVFILHCIEFFLIRLMDISISYGIGMVLDESLENFMEMLYATHISILTWLLIVGVSAVLLWGGIALYLKCEKWCLRHPLYLKGRAYIMAFGLIPLFLFGFDTFVSHRDVCFSYRELNQALPWKNTFSQQRSQVVKLDHFLKPHLSGEKIGGRISCLKGSTERKPDLFLFVIESLRADFITPDIAPNLNRFKLEHINPEVTLAGGNGTQLSWFSIFNSKFPFHFSQMDPKNWKSGSLGLQCLKELGYEVHVFSSVRLSYYQMDKRIFGDEHQLGDSFSLFPADEDIAPYEADQKTIAALTEKLEKGEKNGGRCFVVFLESTHFDYSFPEEGYSKFTPYDMGINHMQIAISKRGLEKIKNRYRNAVYYTDELFGQFQASMEKIGAWDEAVVIVTGDHGEEFYENGHLFHASNLNWEQINVPIFFKLGPLDAPKETVNSLVSHVDIFPTLLHYILKSANQLDGMFDGESILAPKKWPYAIIGRYNGSRNPYEFLIHNGKSSLLAQFNERGKIFNADALHILEIGSEKNETTPLSVFLPALHRLTAD